MGTRSFAQVAPTPATIALNAYIFGYGGHSLVTPHVALKQLWWTEERINAKVTRNFVISKLRGEEREFLDQPLAFGEGLSDHTYMEWILERARRLFLILAEIGLPDQIFGCIDDSWDDDDLPIPLEMIPDLELSIEPDEALTKKFYDTQFIYLLRELRAGSHISYGPREHIPMENADTIPPAVSLQGWTRVHFPGKPEEVFMRRKYALVDKENGRDHRESFMRDVKRARKLPHEHIANVWASYTDETSAYVMSDFVGEHTLNTFIDHRMPAQYQRVPAQERPMLLLRWMHCLADALASLHHRGVAHTTIRPSNILVDRDNRIAFSDVGCLRTFQRGKKVNKVEIYDYAAPESELSSPATLASSPPVSSVGTFSKLRNMSSVSSSSGGSSTGSSVRSNSVCTAATIPLTPATTARTSSIITPTPSKSPTRQSGLRFRNFSRHLPHISSPSSYNLSPAGPSHAFARPSFPDPDTLCALPEALPPMSDVYSLGCVFLDIVTFMLKGRLNDFVKYRTTKITSPLLNSKRARNDSSFHSDPEKISGWIRMLEDDSERRSERVYCGIPELLRLIRKMLQQNATLRPTGLDVRDQLQNILVDLCGLERLCCANRDWSVPVLSDTSTAPSTFYLRDSMSIATGISGTQSTRLALEGQPTTTTTTTTTSSQLGDEERELSRTASITASTSGRRRSSANAPSAMDTWRRALSRSSQRAANGGNIFN